ncbi:MAG: ribonuclease HII [Halothiobacillaceae bacterium]
MRADSYDLFAELDAPKRWVAGVDEAGRGPLAGAVFAAAVILDPEQPIAGLNDSKKLSEKRRETLFIEIQTKALAWSIAEASAAEIDEINILQASLLAMQRAVAGLRIAPSEVWVDGNRAPKFACPARAIIGGDALEPCISAASILAKVARDRTLLDLHTRFPQYGFNRHKGYPTAEHMAALAAHGACPEHRRSFAPVKRVL